MSRCASPMTTPGALCETLFCNVTTTCAKSEAPNALPLQPVLTTSCRSRKVARVWTQATCVLRANPATLRGSLVGGTSWRRQSTSNTMLYLLANGDTCETQSKAGVAGRWRTVVRPGNRPKQGCGRGCGVSVTEPGQVGTGRCWRCDSRCDARRGCGQRCDERCAVGPIQGCVGCAARIRAGC